MEVTIHVIVVSRVVGLHGAEIVDIDTDMFVVVIQQVAAQYSVKLHSKDMVAGIAIGLLAEEAEELVGERSGHVLGRGDEEGEAVRTHTGGDGADGKHERGGEGLHRAVVGSLTEVQRGRVERLAFKLGRAIGQVEEAIGRDRGQAVEDDACVGKAGIDELLAMSGS